MRISRLCSAINADDLHFSAVIDQLDSLIIQSAASLQIPDHRVDRFSVPIVVMIDSEAERPGLSKGSVRGSCVPGAPMPVSPTITCKHQKQLQ